jgi:hypothetical protein
MYYETYLQTEVIISRNIIYINQVENRNIDHTTETNDMHEIRIDGYL